MKWSIWDGVFAQMVTMLTTGALLSGYAVHLGVPNTLLGLIAAIIPISQLAQIPAVRFIEVYGTRKRWALGGAFVGRVAWLGVSVIPWLFTDAPKIGMAVFVTVVVVSFFAQSVAGCAYASWMKALIPPETLGRFFGKRLGLSTIAGAAVMLAGGFWIEHAQSSGHSEWAFIPVFVTASLLGLAGLVFLWKTPEPPRPPTRNRESLYSTISRPLKDLSFRPILRFTAAWNLAVHFGGPFFVVYMLERIQLDMGTIVVLSVLGQAVNVTFVSLWGPIVDRLGHVGVLRIAVVIFSSSFLIWPFTTFPEVHSLTLPLLALAEVMMGVGTSGITLCGNNLVLKSAPADRPTAYLATNAFVTGIFATVAPVLGGTMGDAMALFEVSLVVRWEELAGYAIHELPTLILEGLDFVFFTAFVLGLYAAHRTLGIREHSERRTRMVVWALGLEMRRHAMSLGGAPVVRSMVQFPYASVRRRGSSRHRPR